MFSNHSVFIKVKIVILRFMKYQKASLCQITVMHSLSLINTILAFSQMCCQIFQSNLSDCCRQGTGTFHSSKNTKLSHKQSL